MGVASRDSGDLEPSPAGHRNWESIVWALERANASLRGGQCLFERCHAFLVLTVPRSHPIPPVNGVPAQSPDATNRVVYIVESDRTYSPAIRELS